jgi:predicted HTH transcriptional regulator
MLTSETVKSIIAGGDGYNVNFKTLFGQKVIISLNAFNNSRGGMVLTGFDNVILPQ